MPAQPGVVRAVLAWCATAVLALGCNSRGSFATAGPMDLLTQMERAFTAHDVGEVMLWVDGGYQDGQGGRGRLEDDLRQLFEVYGKLSLDHHDARLEGEVVEAHLQMESPRLRYRGPHLVGVRRSGDAWMLQTGVLEIPRGILDTLRERRLALEEGSILRLGRLISDNYRGKGGGKKELISRLKDDLSGGQRAMMVDEVIIEAERERAEVIQSFLLIVIYGDKKDEVRGREKLRLHHEAGRWRIIAGLG